MSVQPWEVPIARLTGALEQIASRLDGIDRRLDAVEHRFAQVDAKFSWCIRIVIGMWIATTLTILFHR